MRRVWAFILVATLMLQSTVASASTPGDRNKAMPLPAMLASTLQPLVSAIQESQIVMLLDGQGERYALMHQRGPIRPVLPRWNVQFNVHQTQRAVGQKRSGSALQVRLTDPLTSRALVVARDPLAMAHGFARMSRPLKSHGRLTPDVICQVAPRSGVTTQLLGGGGCTNPTPAPTLRPSPTPAPTPTPTPTPKPTVPPTPTPLPTPVPTPTPIPVTPTPVPTATPITALPSAVTGINPYWTFQERTLAGIGKAMINISTGNLLVQADDIDVPERGIDLAFRRTYNAMSSHDAANTDVSTQGVYGNGWTNTFDAHLAYNANLNIISVYDIDGARYDYSSDGNGNWIAPPGQHSALTFDGACGYHWTKKTGTDYYFWSAASTCNGQVQPALLGRLYQITGRNHNNVITFTYSWAGGDASNTNNLVTIVASHADGQSLTLNFALFGANTELQSVVRPDGQSVNYNYDSSGNLIEADRPGNAVDATRATSITRLPEAYAYTGNHLLYTVGGPRYTWSNEQGVAPDGGYYVISYDGSGRVSQTADYGVVNFTPADGVNQLLQTSPSGIQEWYTEAYSGWGSGTISYTDSTGHGIKWSLDPGGRASTTQEWTGALWLTKSETWDANDNLISSTDARGNETDYAYDSNGNTIAVAEPSTATSLGTLRPTGTYSYDGYNNVVAYCDPYQNAKNGANWTSTPAPTDSLCPSAAGSTRYSYDYSDTNGEPFGKLSDTYTPLGYHRHISYDPSAEGGDFGLPTAVLGDVMTQNDGSSRQPSQSFSYDSYGDLAAYNSGNGSWSLVYDTLHRNTQRTDPDGVVTYTCYNPDGSAALERSMAQYAADNNVGCVSLTPSSSAGVSYVYDADGNALSETHHYGCAALSACASGVTQKWYDGEDRLVEVRQPQDASDAYQFPWITRYIYDIGATSTEPLNGATVSTYGNLYKTQECLQGTSVSLLSETQGVHNASSNVPANPVIAGSCSFTDVRGNGFDALDRSIAKYEIASGALPQSTTTYDGNGQSGFVSQKENATNQIDTLTYDANGRLASETFNDGLTANRNYSYDPNGRVTTMWDAVLGSEIRQYDGDGRLVTQNDPPSLEAAGQISYGYYADGMRKSLSLAIPSSNFNQSNLFTYNYRADGRRSSLVDADSDGSGTFSWTYTAAGRELTQTDPFTGTAVLTNTLVAKNTTYDANGRIATMQLPRSYNTLNGFTYDLEGNLTGFSATNAQVYGGGPYLQYTTRNEAFPDNSAGTGIFGNGASCTFTSCVFDTRNDQLISSTSTQTDCSGGSCYPVSSAHAYTYDAAGRETKDAYQPCSLSNPDPTVTSVRTYDTNNHVVQQTLPANYESGTQTCNGGNPTYLSSTQNSYTWGGAGHISRIVSTVTSTGNSTTTTSVHWDGDEVLYLAGSSGTPMIYIEKLGESGQASIGGSWTTNIEDRGPRDIVMDKHQRGAFSALTIAMVHPFPQTTKTGAPLAASVGGPSGADAGTAPPYPGAISPLSVQRTDGYSDGVNVFQGARVYDPNMNQWTSPDAYAGDVHDPMSQKPYMWNNNNPVAYSDPTGFDALLDFVQNGAGGLGHVEIITYDNKALNGRMNSLESAHGNPFGDKTAISHNAVSDVRKLPTEGHTYFHLATTPEQNQKITSSYDSHSGQNYNLITNNCDTTADAALRSAGITLPELSGAIPNLDAKALGAKNSSTNPSGLKPEGSGSSNTR